MYGNAQIRKKKKEKTFNNNKKERTLTIFCIL